MGTLEATEGDPEDFALLAWKSASSSTFALIQVSAPGTWPLHCLVLHQQLLYACHYQRMQALAPGDHPARVTSCQWFIRQTTSPAFASSILFTDDATFWKDVITNFHNDRQWTDDNPHATISGRHQQQIPINVWAGPYLSPPLLTGEVCRLFLITVLPELLDHVPLDVRARMWFMHDCAPAHFSRPVRVLLDETFNCIWIGRSGPVAFSPRSRDVNPLDFNLWGHVNSLVYATPIANAEVLQRHNFEACETIRSQHGISGRVHRSMISRVHACVAAQGGHFEYLLELGHVRWGMTYRDCSKESSRETWGWYDNLEQMPQSRINGGRTRTQTRVLPNASPVSYHWATSLGIKYRDEKCWSALNIEVLFADAFEVRCGWSSSGMQGRMRQCATRKLTDRRQ
ncbi:hypothetical protein PR048_016642 [Dryococelus australis]|uniref:Uncharacterized protein n=1 Tax=Dryococelus australis TaxID=614101 RepID=A0ABQ9H7F6_9NEOP|nr:hypothetical protein PR048_016642 [Dryococelus australis]